jgi:hypothetical protein
MINYTNTRNSRSSSSTIIAVDSIVERKELCFQDVDSTPTTGVASVKVLSIINDKQQSLSSPPERIQTRENKNNTTSIANRISQPKGNYVVGPSSAVTLFDLIDEDFVICNTNVGFKYLLHNKPVGSIREGRGRTTILDQIDGLVKEEGDDTFMTSRSYPRGVHIITRRSSSNTSYFDLVVAEESFKYWKHEIHDPTPKFTSSSSSKTTTGSKSE